MYKTAIIGCGRIAGGYDRVVPEKWSATHAGAYLLCADTQLVAVSDPDTGALNAFQEKWQVDKGYEDYEEMLQKENLDIISLCLPTEHHCKAFKRTLDHGIKAVYCEKPLAYRLDEAKEMIEMGKGKFVTVNYFRRWNPTFQEIREQIKRGDLGPCKSVVVKYTKGLYVNASHFIDMVRWFFGEPLEIKYLSNKLKNKQDPGFDFLMNMPDGVSVYFLNLPDVPFVFADVDIIAEKGRVVFSQRGQWLIKHTVEKEPYYGFFNILGAPEERETEWRNCTTRAVYELINCIKKGSLPSCTLEDGYRTLEICNELIEQSKLGR